MATKTKSKPAAQKKHHLERQNFFSRTDQIGKTKQSILFGIIGASGKEGITRNQILTYLKQKKEIRTEKEERALNYCFDDMQKKFLIKKEKGRNAKYKVGTAIGKRELERVRKEAAKNGAPVPTKIDLSKLPEKAA